MGHVFAEIGLGNPRRPEQETVRVRALAASGKIPAAMRSQ